MEGKLRPLTAWLRERGRAVAAPDLLRAMSSLQYAARAGLADDIRAIFPRAVDVRIEMPDRDQSAEGPSNRRKGRTPKELLVEYLASEGVEDARVVTLFEQLYDDATAEAIA